MQLSFLFLWVKLSLNDTMSLGTTLFYYPDFNKIFNFDNW
jgi:hypothetical protein